MTDQATAPKTRTRKAGTKKPTDKGTTAGQTQAQPSADGAAILADVRAGMGKQTQAKDAAAKPAPKKRATKPKGDGQQQAGGEQGSAGAGTAGKTPDANSTAGEMRGGTKQVLITEVKMPGRGGRPQGEEEYPFGDLPFGKREGTDMVGPSFFIPDSDNPDSHLATARKRHKGVKFHSRMMMEKIDGVMVKGLRIWKEQKDA